MIVHKKSVKKQTEQNVFYLVMAESEPAPESRAHRANAEARAIQDLRVTSCPLPASLSASADALVAAAASAPCISSHALSTFSNKA